MLCICEHFSPEERNDVVTDDLPRFVAEIRVVDAEISVKPVDFIGDELLRDETLIE